jgi:hypothetical protein
MPASVAAILGELKQIEQRSPEDVAVLMTPLLRALQAVRDGRAPHLEHAQAMAIANSLAQTAAQAGDVDAAVAIAGISAELEQLPAATFSAPPPAAARPAAQVGQVGGDAAQGRGPKPGFFAHPHQQLFGILGICALSYAGYLEIQAHFQPGSVASWLLTGSSSLFALGVALFWRRFVVRGSRGPALTALSLVFALVAGGWALQTRMTLRPQLAAGGWGAPPPSMSAAPSPGPEADAGASAGTATSSADAPEDADATGNEGPIAFWWLGETPGGGATRLPPAPASDPAAEPATKPADGATTGMPMRASSVAPPAAGMAAQSPPPGAPRAASAPPVQEHTTLSARSQRRPDSPMARYRDLLDRDVVVTDVKGGRHAGKLMGISKHGVTLQMEVSLFGEPILAQRFYLFDNIENLRAE